MRGPTLAGVTACLIVGTSACDGPAPTAAALCDLSADISPGCGAVLPGGELRIGDPLDIAVPVLGADPVELGSMGLRVDTDLASATFAADAPHPLIQLELRDGFEGQSAEGVGIGAAAAHATDAWGAPITDPFTGATWHASAGVGVQWSESGAATAITVLAARR